MARRKQSLVDTSDRIESSSLKLRKDLASFEERGEWIFDQQEHGRSRGGGGEKFSLASPKEHTMDPAGAAAALGKGDGWISIRKCSSLEVWTLHNAFQIRIAFKGGEIYRRFREKSGEEWRGERRGGATIANNYRMILLNFDVVQSLRSQDMGNILFRKKRMVIFCCA